MDFISIDFETANEKRNSACSLGIVVVKNNEIVEEKYWLIKPYEMRFAPMNVWIHGIDEEDVENEKRMDELWDEIKPYIENNFVIAHNASFDMSVLRKTLDAYRISYPKFDYSCTMIMAKKFYKELENHKLNTIARHLGIKFKHHHALEDAEAAAKILINIAEELKVNTIDELCSQLDLKIGRVYEEGYSAAGSMVKNMITGAKMKEQSIDIKDVALQNKKSDIEYGFLNKVFVFTGPLQSFKRAEAMQKVRNAGGMTGSSVTKKTNYLVVGVRNIDKLSYDKKSTKLRKAEMLIESGQDIKIISEEEFLDMFHN